jgi:hypothetical protein
MVLTLDLFDSEFHLWHFDDESESISTHTLD